MTRLRSSRAHVLHVVRNSSNGNDLSGRVWVSKKKLEHLNSESADVVDENLGNPQNVQLEKVDGHCASTCGVGRQLTVDRQP